MIASTEPGLCERNRELSADPAFAGRIRRLAATSAVALGVLWVLWHATVTGWPGFEVALLAGWVTMPSLLTLSLRASVLRWALAVPSVLVGVPTVAAAVGAVDAGGGVARAGWALVAAGIVLGAALGTWFWFRLLPVPRAFDDPFAPGRLALIGVHVAGIVAGLLLVGVATA